MKYLIVGLGNPGAQYEDNRHNIGFKCVEALAKEHDVGFGSMRYAMVASIRHKGRTIILIKPQTFMNLSGKAVRYWLAQEKLDPTKMLVITDDLALPFGRIRIRAAGGAGGHNGLTDIIRVLGTKAFPRLRFGIGHEFARGNQVSHVLGDWTEQERETLEERVQLVVQAVTSFATIGLDRTMSTFNNK